MPMDRKTWSDNIAALAADALVDAKLIRKEDFEKVSAVIAEEVHVRLCLNDYPAGQPNDIS